MVASTSVGAIVPSVKSEPLSDLTPPEESGGGEATPPLLPAQHTQQPLVMPHLQAPPETAAEAEEMDKELLCPICMQTIKDAFLTSCGHSFCYMCIVTHLQNKNDCPCCAHFLTANHLYPNFLLNKVSFPYIFSPNFILMIQMFN